MTKKEMREKFETYHELRKELWNMCADYVHGNGIRPNEEFDDFFLLNDDKVALLFIDDDGDYVGTYTSVDLEDLSAFNKD